MFKLTINKFNEISFSAYDSYSLSCSGEKKKRSNNKRSSSSLARSRSVFMDYAKNNEFNYFMTITIDSKKKDISKMEEIKTQILHFFNNFKCREDSEFRYIMVAELGKKNQRLHFHGLIYTEKEKKFLKHVKNGKYRNEFLYNNIGANQFLKIDDYTIKCANYCIKYFTKDNISFNIFKHAYYCSKGLMRSREITSEFDSNLLLAFFKFIESENLVSKCDFCSSFTCDYEKFYKLLNFCLTNYDSMDYYISASEDYITNEFA